MALVLTISNLKGGVGKTCVATNLAACIHRDGHDVVILDLDEQGTARDWRDQAVDQDLDGPPVLGMSGKQLKRDVERIASTHDVLVIDTPPRLGADARAAMIVSDLVIIPMTPGAEAAWALEQTRDALDEVRAIRPDLRAVVLFNQADFTRVSQATNEVLKDSGLDVFEVKLGRRVAFAEATMNGQGVIDYAPNSVAAREVREFTQAVLERAR